MYYLITIHVSNMTDSEYFIEKPSKTNNSCDNIQQWKSSWKLMSPANLLFLFFFLLFFPATCLPCQNVNITCCKILLTHKLWYCQTLSWGASFIVILVFIFDMKSLQVNCLFFLKIWDRMPHFHFKVSYFSSFVCLKWLLWHEQ